MTETVNEDDTEPPIVAEMRAMWEKPEFIRALDAVKTIADFDVPPPNEAVFLRFHRFLTAPQPHYITRWRNDPRSEKWYHLHVNGILGDVRGALSAAYYHKDNLKRLEQELFGALKQSGLIEQMGDITTTFGNTRKLDYEYQAFILACRRSLDYLSGALACYFKTECYSFRTLPKSINTLRPSNVVEAIRGSHARHVQDLDYIMAEGRRSVRNRIAHYEFVSAGQINVNRNGLMLAGGGEPLTFEDLTLVTPLGDALSERLSRLQSCIDDTIDSFIAAARQCDAASYVTIRV